MLHHGFMYAVFYGCYALLIVNNVIKGYEKMGMKWENGGKRQELSTVGGGSVNILAKLSTDCVTPHLSKALGNIRFWGYNFFSMKTQHKNRSPKILLHLLSISTWNY